MPKVTASKITRAPTTTKALRPRSTVNLEKTAAESTSSGTKKNARAARPYDKLVKTECAQPAPIKREGARIKAERSSAKNAESSSSQQTGPGHRSYDPALIRPKIIARKFIGEKIVLLHCECIHDQDQIRLQYRDGTPLPRPNAMGFELFDRLARQPVAWNGYGTPLVYQALIYKRGSYVLRYKGLEAWEYSTDDWADFWKRQEELSKTPYDWDTWNRIWKCVEHGSLNPIPFEKLEPVVYVGSLIGAVEKPGSGALDHLPRDLFPRCDLETTYQFQQYKRRTGKVFRY
ncbi:uncharacterized protein SCHCODRAFT_02574194 [Schizophyllum commune H4-8]|nr:uncharacterized protein SCHCODRAFT_02574194 [Schizophyllum commune H4-8]KAI5893090.1 hypothetical protein SCHCODRAFT_02574194 [Schizophyllum commune H4-8]